MVFAKFLLDSSQVELVDDRYGYSRKISKSELNSPSCPRAQFSQTLSTSGYHGSADSRFSDLTNLFASGENPKFKAMKILCELQPRQ